MTATRHLYLALHADADRENGDLTATGRRQAVLLGRALRRAGVEALFHGPLPRAEQTAHLAD
ncbi:MULTISPECIES: histidine phosphatase family protein [unclassified Nocardiopsis]|uniref:histidine phosphatase family protein n=1 Tax=unclassified Nocardiopsis TaxID=2649073 RepID=UPI00135A45A6